jgi:hypothetical protein
MECDRRKRHSAGPAGLTIRPDIAPSSLQYRCAEAKPPRRLDGSEKQRIPAHPKAGTIAGFTELASTPKILMKSSCVAPRYCLASGAASTCLQAAGNCASVIGFRGFGGSFGGLGWMIESLNQ